MFGALVQVVGVPSPSQHALACWQLEEIALASKRDWEKDRMRGVDLHYQTRKRSNLSQGRGCAAIHIRRV